MNDLNVVSLCDGISCGRVALERAAIKVNKYYACEIKPHAIKVSQSNYPDIIQLGDLTKVDIGFWKSLKGNIDLFLCGSPCQDLSVANSQRKGLKGAKSSLFYKCVEIMEIVKPKYFLFENVVMTGENLNIFNELLNVEPTKINSCLVSAQNRKRLYWSNIRFGSIAPKCIRFKDIQEPNQEFRDLGKWVFSKFGGEIKLNGLKTINATHAHTLTTNRTHSRQYYLNETRDKYRNLTPLEWERLQTLPEGYTSVLPKTKRCEVIGDAWTVDVIAHILKGLK